MAVVKILRNRNVVALEQYVFDGRMIDDPVEMGGCIEGSISEQFIATQLHHGEETGVEAIHIIQSWSEKDSSLLTPEDYTSIGRKMIEELFPGHEFCVVTHTDTGKVHNHIVVNPVHAESGKRIQNKLRLRDDLCAKSDELCLGAGLSIIEKQSRETWKRVPEKVRELRKRGGFSWVLDLKEKAKFACSIATSFDEYAGILNQFGIQVRVESKNVVYHYPDKPRKRGDSAGLGQKYDRAGLIETFKKNYDAFFEAGLKTTPIGQIDFENHWKFHRAAAEYFVPEYRYKDLVVPPSLLKTIQNIDLETQGHLFGLEFTDIEGKKCLKGREHISVDGNCWSNTATGARGRAFEMLAFLHGESWLESLKRFDTTGRIEKVIQVAEKTAPIFQAFYLPREIRSNHMAENQTAGNMLALSAFAIQHLARKNLVSWVGNKKLKVRSEENPKSSITVHRIGTNWVCRKEAGVSSPLIHRSKSVKDPLLIFEDPISFLSSGGFIDKILKDRIGASVLVPMKPLSSFLNDDLWKFRDHSKIVLVRSAHRLAWGRNNHEKRCSDKQVSKYAEQFRLSYKSIDELLRDLILGRFGQKEV